MLTRSQAIAAAGLVVALAHEQHVKTPGGAEWYNQPIGSLIVKKPHLHADISDDHHMITVGDHHYSIPSGAKVYVGAKSAATGTAETAGKLVQLGPEGHAKYVLISGDGHVGEISWQVGAAAVKDKGWLPYHLSAKPSAVPILKAGGNSMHASVMMATATDLASAISILSAAKSTNVKPPLAKAGHKLADMDYMQIAKDELKAHPELAVPSGTKAQHVGKVKIAVLHHLGAQLEKVKANDAEAAAAKAAQEAAAEQAQVAQKLTPSVLDFHGLAVTKDTMQAAADAVDATGSHGSLSTALKKINSPLASLDHYAVAKAWKKEHPEDKGLSTKAAYTAAIKGALADLGDADQATGHEDAVKVAEAVKAAPKPEPGATGYASVNEALAAAMVKADSTGNSQYVSTHPNYKGEYDHSSVPPEAGEFYVAKPTSVVVLKPSPVLAGIPLSDATLSAMVGKHLAGTGLEPKAPEPTVPDVYGQLQELMHGPAPGHPDSDDWASVVAEQMWHSENGTGSIKARYVYKGLYGNWFSTTSQPAADTEYYTVSGMSLTRHVPGKPGAEIISVLDTLNTVSPYFTAKGKPPELPKPVVPYDVAELVKPGAFGAELDPTDPDVKTWIGLIPGGEYVAAQVAQAAIDETPRVVFMNVVGAWAWKTGNAPPASALHGHGWWKVYPAGSAVYYPPAKVLDSPPDPAFHAEPALDPAAVLAQVVKESGGQPVMFHTGLPGTYSPEFMAKIKALPGGKQALDAKGVAATSGVTHVAYNDSLDWLITAGNQPPTANQKAAGWWEAHPDGKLVFHPAAAPSLKDTLEGAKAQATKSAAEIQAAKALADFVKAGGLKGPESTSDKWSKLAVALKKSSDKPGKLYYAVTDGNQWWWAAEEPTTIHGYYEVENGAVTGWHPAHAESGFLEDVYNDVIKGAVTPYFSTGTPESAHAQDQLGALIAASKNKVPGGDDTNIWSKIAAALLATDKTGQTWYVITQGPVYSTTTDPASAGGKGYIKVTPDHKVVKVGAVGNELDLLPENVLHHVKEHLVPDLSKPLGTEFPHAEPPAPGLTAEVQALIAEGEPVSVDPTDQALVAALPGGETAKAAIQTIHAYAYQNMHVKESTYSPGTWTSSTYGAPTAAQKKAGYWELNKSGDQIKVTYYPPPKPLEPGSPEANLYELLLHGAVLPPSVEEKKNFYHVLARAMNLTAKGLNNGTYYVRKQEYLNNAEPSFTWDKNLPVGEYWRVDDGINITHVLKGGTQEKVPVNTLTGPGGVTEHVTPNAVVAQVSYGVWKAVKHGHWYKPGGGAHVEIYPTPTGVAHKYHFANGSSKDINGSKAISYITNKDFTEHFDQPKPGPKPKVKAAVTADLKYATAAGPGSWLTSTMGGGLSAFIVHPDGSSTYHSSISAASTFDAAKTKPMLLAGAVLDQYGNSLVTPGESLKIAHVFGVAQDSLPHLYGQLAVSSLGSSDLDKVLGFKTTDSTNTTTPQGALMLKFLESKGATTYPEEKAAIMGLLQEMLNAPSGFSAGSSEPVFLKGLPPGIHHPEDIFDFGSTGWAAPYGGGLTPMIDWGTNTQMKAQIKAVSEQFGGGKVVGTHVSSMGSGPLQEWIKAWKSGDMAKVFALDAAGGKVSPVHPGAPKNTGTHKVVWAPYGEGQVPAGFPIEGNWSATSVTMPHAEVDNYLVKANLQHAEFLSWDAKRSWVNAHRAGEWYTVNKLTKQADDSWLAHDTPQTPTPVWTEHIEPATSYTTYLEDKNAATSWSVQAINDFVEDHASDVGFQAAVDNWNSTTGYSEGSPVWATSYSSKKDVLQLYLDGVAAKEAAELAKPKYNLITAPGEQPAFASDQFGHEYSFWPGPLDQFHAQPAVAALANAWGFKMPASEAVTLEDGTTGLATVKPDVISPLAGKSLAGLTAKQAAGVAREHVLDWVLASPYGHPGNLLLTPDGDVIAAAKPDALAHLDWDGLAGDAGADEYAKLAITGVFDAIKSHEMPQPVADEAAKAAIRTARRMSQMQDYRLAGYLIAARGETPETATEATKELVGALVTRKASLGEDIEDLWHQVYEDAGWKLPEIPKEALPYGLHSGFNEPSYFDHVIASKSHGAPAFFGGTDLEDGHFLTWTELSGQNRLIRGEAKARGDAQAALTAWCQANQTHGTTSAGSAALSTMTQAVADPNVPKGDSVYYGKIVSAAKAVSRHAQDQLFEGTHTKTALENMAGVKTELEAKLLLAGKALEGDENAIKEFVSAGNGHPWMATNMAKYYLDLIAKVEDAKAAHGTFKPGDLVQWKAPELPEEFKPKAAEPAKPAPKVLKVERKKAFRELGIPAGHVSASSWLLGEDDGELHLSGATYQYPGDAWHIELPTGEIIEFNDCGITGTPAGPQTGRIRYKADASKGSASLERIRAQLETMGLPLPEATPDDMELLYWRHLAGALASRADTFSGKHKAVWDSLHESMKAHGLSPEAGSKQGEGRNIQALAAAKLDPGEEAAIWRKAWANLTSPEQVAAWADEGGFYPHLRHWDVKNPEVTGGLPDWYRFDATPEWVNSVSPLSHSFHYSDRDAVLMARTGGGLSTEARIRVLGSYITGTSSAGDMTSHGSSGVFYLRPPNYGASGAGILVNPAVLAYTQTYGFDNDAWGDIAQRTTSSKFDLPGAAAHSTETVPKDGVSLLDDIELVRASSETQRHQIIKELKAHGITEIRGLPVEDRIATSANWSAASNKVRAHLKTLNPLERGPVYVAPPQEKVTVEHALITTEAETTAQAKVAEASADHTLAASKETLNKVYYGSAAGDGQSQDQAHRASIKKAAATRVAAAMKSTDDQILALKNAAGLAPPEHWGDTPRSLAAAGLLMTWAANGSNGPLVQALQNRAHDLFGIPKAQLPVINPAPGSQAKAAKLLEDHQTVIDDFLTAMHATTQADLAKEGITHLTMYRLLKFPSGSAPEWAVSSSAGDVIDAAPQRAFSSWGMSPEEIDTDIVWGSGSAVMVKATFPAELALAYPKSGLGCYPQGEFVVLDAPGKWEVVKNQAES